ncbi:hypothetical protein L2K70_10945 [Nocardioides KLBMP 9356]|uniref:Uncharacterized protein n=1 Tax=Nocardioides potassii TaxID=2911371 RepID=A0ABS9HCH2_9ACTN|nr:hypothetical protein [Nocardioides potassii]MCF6378119.1 hypothetical protein [Nocardioides potassii]
MTNWTQQQVRALIAHARAADPRWSWKLAMRPESAALLDLEAGLVWSPDPAYGPLEVKKFDECEIATLDLGGDFVLASPLNDQGTTPSEDVDIYWLNLKTGFVGVWDEDSLSDL